MSSDWRPLLDGELAEEAATAVDAIMADLATVNSAAPTYSDGYAGFALFHGYTAVAKDQEESAHLAVTHLEAALDRAAEVELPLGFFQGLTGIAWVSHHLKDLLGVDEQDEITQDLDDFLGKVLDSSPWRAPYDLINGLVGFGCYALDHPDKQFAATTLDQIVQHLADISVAHNGGVTWRTPRDFIGRTETAQLYPDGYFNIGMSHGVAGIIALLGRVCSSNLIGGKARPLLDDAMKWLLNSKRSSDEGSVFPYYFSDSPAGTHSARSAWCYGDPGVASALLVAARAVGEPSWEKEAIAISLKDCARAEEETGVVDAELCHGAAGLGHIWNRFYQVTGEEAFAAASRHWLKRTLEMRQPGKGIGGFSCFWPDEERWHAEEGLLTGATGIGLALLAAISPVEPNWDRPMLLPGG